STRPSHLQTSATSLHDALPIYGAAQTEQLESYGAGGDMTQQFETIRLDVADGVATLTLNRPDRLNSFNDAMHGEVREALARVREDRKSTRLNSSHVKMSYAVLC